MDKALIDDELFELKLFAVIEFVIVVV